jgi:hypothetical protein
MTMTRAEPASALTRRDSTSRWEALSGLAFVAFFAGSLAASSPPADNAPDSRWIASYTGTAHQAGHLASGLLLVLAGLSLLAFLTGIWRRMATAGHASSPSPLPSPLPIVTAAVSASCIAAGGIVMGVISGGELMGSYPLPGADVLRLTNDLGFALAGVAGMIAAGFTVACLSVQGYRLGLIGPKTRIFGIAVGIVLLASIAFVPIIALLIWVVVTAIQSLRRNGALPGRRVDRVPG